MTVNVLVAVRVAVLVKVEVGIGIGVAVGAILVRLPPGHQEVSEGVKLGVAAIIVVVVGSSPSLGTVATITRLVEVATQAVDVIKIVGIGVTIISV